MGQWLNRRVDIGAEQGLEVAGKWKALLANSIRFSDVTISGYPAVEARELEYDCPPTKKEHQHSSSEADIPILWSLP